MAITKQKLLDKSLNRIKLQQISYRKKKCERK